VERAEKIWHKDEMDAHGHTEAKHTTEHHE
jgi:hypothetical protein